LDLDLELGLGLGIWIGIRTWDLDWDLDLDFGLTMPALKSRMTWIRIVLALKSKVLGLGLRLCLP
jgi:hypothetical protein